MNYITISVTIKHHDVFLQGLLYSLIVRLLWLWKTRGFNGSNIQIHNSRVCPLYLSGRFAWVCNELRREKLLFQSLIRVHVSFTWLLSCFMFRAALFAVNAGLLKSSVPACHWTRGKGWTGFLAWSGSRSSDSDPYKVCRGLFIMFVLMYSSSSTWSAIGYDWKRCICKYELKLKVILHYLKARIKRASLNNANISEQHFPEKYPNQETGQMNHFLTTLLFYKDDKSE